MTIFALIMLGCLVALGVCHLFFPAAARWLFELRNRFEGGAQAYQPPPSAAPARS